MTDTTQNNPGPEFAATNRRIVIGGSGYSHRWSFVYTPSELAKSWDGADARTTHCIGSRFGHYSYVEIKVTGRGDRYDVPGTIDEETVDGWLVGGGDSVSVA